MTGRAAPASAGVAPRLAAFDAFSPPRTKAHGSRVQAVVVTVLETGLERGCDDDLDLGGDEEPADVLILERDLFEPARLEEGHVTRWLRTADRMSSIVEQGYVQSREAIGPLRARHTCPHVTVNPDVLDDPLRF